MKYNTWYYGREVQGDAFPWCMTFVQWLFRDTGLLKKTASCTDLYNWLNQQGRIYKEPEPGDIVFFNFGESKKTCSHTGIVVSKTNTGIISIEGNTAFEKDSTGNPFKESNGGAVAKRTRKANVIVGYGRPYKNTKPVLKKGCKGNDVTYLQKRLASKGYTIGEIDGIFGKKTECAVSMFQSDMGIEVDGIVGAMTWGMLEN